MSDQVKPPAQAKDQDADNSGLPPKRRKPNPKSRAVGGKQTHQACSTCKAKKIRCDSSRPRCSYCALRNRECTYPPVYKRAVCSQALGYLVSDRLIISHVDYLKAKMKEYEAKLGIPGPRPENANEKQIPQTVENEEGLGVQPPGQPSGTEPTISDSTSGLVFDAISGNESNGFDDDASEGTPVMDGMVEMGNNTFYGDTSSFHFAMNIKASTKKEITSPGERQKEDKYDFHKESFFCLGEKGMLDEQESYSFIKSYILSSNFNSLPARHIATCLLDRYFSTCHPIWPFNLEDVTRKKFNQTWESNEKQSPLWIAQLNLIFALACQCYEDEPELESTITDAYQTGRQFYFRARNLIVATAFNYSSVQMVRALLLMAQYQQYTLRANESWLAIGHATRMAQGLGLHVSNPIDDGLPPEEREVRKRLWWGCFCLDRVSSMVYGRPIRSVQVNLKASQSNLPLADDDIYIARGQKQPEGVPSLNAFFLTNIKMYYIVDEILSRLHGPKMPQINYHELDLNDSDSWELSESLENRVLCTLTTIIQFDRILMKGLDARPDFLKFTPGSITPIGDLPFPILNQKNMLNARFLGLRILLHRQSLLFLLQKPETRSWPQSKPGLWRSPFSDVSAEPATTTSTSNETTPPTPFEISMAQLSAGICATSAQQLIELIDYWRPLRLSQVWALDFHSVFTSLCVLFAVMALRDEDRVAVYPDIQKAKDLVRRGFGIIHMVRHRDEKRVERSERFLRRLMKATCPPRQQQQQQPQQQPNRPEPKNPHFSNTAPAKTTDNPTAVTSNTNTNIKLPNYSTTTPSQNQPSTQTPSFNLPPSSTNQPIIDAHAYWTDGMPTATTQWLQPDADENDLDILQNMTDPNSMEDLFHDSFNLWNTFDFQGGWRDQEEREMEMEMGLGLGGVGV
ncbi:MAG: hypothetical protein M1834_001247 [Cirrosporium novae-zelandiae]|nr:MAG: hypothetical protein M1834_001247 [Cirrosporium novae-zelandiae]